MRDLRTIRARDYEAATSIAPLLVAAIGSAVIGGGASLLAANKAANASERATDQSLALQRQQFDQTRQDFAPFLNAGTNALNPLMNRLGAGPPAGGGAPGNALNSVFSGGSTGGGWEDAYLAANPDVMQAYYADPNAQAKGSPQDWARYHWSAHGQQEVAQGSAGRVAPGATQAQPEAAPSTIPTQGGIDPSSNSLSTLMQQVMAERPPTPERAPAPERPVMTRPTVAPVDVSLASYEKSPGYEFQQTEARRGTVAGASATGALQSGAAMKALQDRAQNIAKLDYRDWRDYTTSQGNRREDVANANFAFDAGRSDNNYQFGVTRGDNIHNLDRAFNTDVYNLDRGQALDIYNRGTDDLFRLAGIGTGAAGQTAAAGQNYTSGSSNAIFSNAANQGNAALSSANSLQSLIGQGLNAYAYSQGVNRPGAR